MITTSDGVELEGIWTTPDSEPVGTVVLCHPHPLDGGTMTTPLIRTVAATLGDAGLVVLRFNFRGVGASQGTWGGGSGEVLDVAAAVELAASTHPGLPTGVAGWSFGASVSLAWQAESGSLLPWVGIAPGIRPYRGSLPPDFSLLVPARRRIVIGDRDQFATVADIEHFALRSHAEVTVLPGSDHFFLYRERKVGEVVAAHFGGRTPTPS
jgi:alpha/beta superfamily hydrolase